MSRTLLFLLRGRGASLSCMHAPASILWPRVTTANPEFQAQAFQFQHRRLLSSSQAPNHDFKSQTGILTSTRVAIITGASRGIGKAIALRLASDGYDIALNDLPSARRGLDEVSEKIRQGLGRKTLVCPGDVCVEDDVRGLVRECVDELGGVDVMVSNAGICFAKRPILQHTTTDWDKIMRINVRGAFFCYKYAAEQMIKQARGGRIIGACSMAGKKGIPEFSSYCASKFAVRGLTQSAALEWASHGITVNTYAPGPIESDMLTLITETNPTTQIKGIVLEPAVGFQGKPEDVAGLVSYLASEEARFVTGQTYTIDGGMVLD